jgi:hypothetical protein
VVLLRRPSLSVWDGIVSSCMLSDCSVGPSDFLVSMTCGGGAREYISVPPKGQPSVLVRAMRL